MANDAWKNQKRREKEREFEEQREQEARDLYERIHRVWEVPDHAAEAFVNLQDAVGEHGALAIAEFVKAMLAPPADPSLEDML